MTAKRLNIRNAVIPNGLSEDEINSSESEDEMSKVTHALRNELNMSENSSTSESDNDESVESEEDESKEKVETNQNLKKKKRMHWVKKDIVTPTADFADSMPPPPIHDELQPIDYFYNMFGKQSTTLLTNQLNLYSVQKNPNKAARISETEMEHFIGILLMTGIYSFPEQRYFWSNSTRVESISSVMTRDRFLELKKYLHVTDNSIQQNRTDANFDRAHKVRPLLNIIKENFRTIPKEEKLSVDEQIIPFKAGGKSGICYDFIFYTGKGNQQQHGFCTDIVLNVCETVPRFANHKVYFDNYFTTIRLQVELKKLGIFSVGTVRPNRLIDLNIKNAKDLSREALLKSSPPPPIIKRGRPSLESRLKSNENNSTATLRTTPTLAPPSSTRFDKYDHWPITTSKGRCRNNTCDGYTRISCSKCGIRLCLNEKKNCFTDYHN
ncbi:unnamed protein product [Rotaria sp. Silwood1]|nr:unnamed protein product [Rotaria sp. Silwood1]